ncbi:6645_t:CDS:2 [Entrophospora sp. SA101]|nr:10660_t:CDS:2 [Entrophospora sp. SA101]CAJ0748291.1 4991_t:CDS:2 [Entrophospora sp. SA101]CAJ0751693.1 6645_t:CDS:2 [Entrophospora sp. SA101]
MATFEEVGEQLEKAEEEYGEVKKKLEDLERGLGGTTYKGLEGGFFYEGVDLTSATVCQREPTINRLLECMFKEHIILFRSPPMTGKTSLGQLLEAKLLQLDELQNGSACCKKYIGEPCHCGSAFWNAFKRIMQNLQLSIVALAPYGHYGAYATREKHICYTKEEFRVYFDRFCEEHLKEKLVKDDIPYLFNYLSKITVYHPGLIVYTMDHIGERFTKKDSNSLSFDILFSYLKSHDFNDLLKTIHAFYPASDLSYEERRIVDAVLFKKGGLDYEAEKIPNDGRLLKTNALVDTSSNKSHIALLDFPAPLH